MCSPGPPPRSMRKRMSQQAREAQEQVDIELEDEVELEIVDDVEEEEPGPSNRPHKARRRRAAADDDAGGAGPSQPATQDPTASRPPRHGGSRRASQHTTQADGTTTKIQYSKEEASQLKQQIQRYKEAAAKQDAEASFSLTPVETENLVGRIVRYMLFSMHEKPGVPVARTRLTDAVTADHKHHKHVKKFLTRLLPEAQFRLLNVFGIEMREVERVPEKRSRGADGGGTAASGTSYYVLRNRLPSALREGVAGAVGGGGGLGVHRALSLVVLAMIHTEGGKMEEGALWQALAGLGVSRQGHEAIHPVLGKVEDELSRLQSARWLLRTTRAPRADGAPEVVYEWGEAAKDEISEREIKEFIDQEFSRRERTSQRASQQQQQQQQAAPEVIEISD